MWIHHSWGSLMKIQMKAAAPIGAALTFIALVTGANRGIGFEICRQLARRRIQVIATRRDEARGEIARRNLADEGLEVAYHRLDVTDPGSVAALFEAQTFDVVINNAGADMATYQFLWLPRDGDNAEPVASDMFTQHSVQASKTPFFCQLVTRGL